MRLCDRKKFGKVKARTARLSHFSGKPAQRRRRGDDVDGQMSGLERPTSKKRLLKWLARRDAVSNDAAAPKLRRDTTK